MREKIDVTAIEPTPSLAETCRERGLRVIEKRAEDAVADPADIAVSFEVLEHTFDPGAFLAACKRLTRDWLVLTCPNVKGFDVEVLGVESPAIDHEHLNYFHPASLTAFVERHGFKVEAIETPGQLDADIVRNRVLNGFELREPFLRRVLIDEWDKHGAAFQAFLAQQQMSSHMWLVARKNA